MFATKTRLAKTVMALGMAAVAVLGGGTGIASAAPTLYTETSLNLNSSLTSNGSGFLVANRPNAADPAQKWQATARFVTLPNGQVAFGWQLKNNHTGTCITDSGNNAPVKLLGCETTPGSTTKQVWMTVDGRTVNGKFYWFWQSATSNRRLQVTSDLADGPFPTFVVIATNKVANHGTALENLMLFNEQVVS